MGSRSHARLRLAFIDGVMVSDGYKSGRSSQRDTPDMSSRVSTRSAGTPLRRHLSSACREIPRRLASAPTPPDTSITRSMGFVGMDLSQPQVESLVNLPLVVPLNRWFHPCGMSPLGKTITARLRSLDQTQAWLAEQVGVSENAVSKWIKTGKISRSNSIAAANALGINVAQLLDPNPLPELDERWHSFPASVKQRVLALVDELMTPPKPEAAQKRIKSQRRA